MTFEDRLRAILAADAQDRAEPPPREPEVAPEPRRMVVISALGGRPAVEVEEEELRRLMEHAVDAVGPDLTPADLGRLIHFARDVGPAALLDALLRVRASTTLYRVRTAEGKPWRPNHNILQEQH